MLVYFSASLLFSFCLLLFRDKQQRNVEQAQKELEKLKAKLQMEENLVEKLTAIRDALERGKLIHRFEGLGKGPKLGEHLMLMGAKEQKWNAQEGQRQAGVQARLEAEKAMLAGMEQKSATPPPVYNALLPLGMPYSSAVPLLAQPFFKIATPSPSARTSSAQVASTQASTPDLEREELEKFAENNASILTAAPPAGTEPLEPLAPSATSEQKAEETEALPPAPTLEVKEESMPASATPKKKKLKKVIADD